MTGAGQESAIPLTGAEIDPGEAAAGLGRSLADRHVAMIAVGGIIGAGLFVGSSSSIAAVGPAVVLSYAIAGTIVMMVMRMLSEMAVAVPGKQTFPDFARLGLGEWAGFLSGWLYWYFWVIVVAIEAVAGAIILHDWIALPVWLLGVALTAILTGVNLLSTRSYGEFEFWLSSLKVGAIIVFVLITGSYVLGLGSPAGPDFANLTAHGGFLPHGVSSLFAGTTSVIFALVGAEIATIAAAETADPARTVSRMAVTVAARILIFYVLAIGLIVIVLPWNEVVPGKSPFAAALVRIGIPGAATIMNAIVLVAVLSCLNSGLYVTSRVLFALAARNDAPAALVRLNGARVPVRAILFASLFAYVALAASLLSPQRVFSFLVNASGSLMLIIYLLIALAQIRLRRRIEHEGGVLSLRMWLFPWASWATIAAIAAILIAMLLDPALASQFWCSLVATGIVLCAFVLTRRARRG